MFNRQEIKDLKRAHMIEISELDRDYNFKLRQKDEEIKAIKGEQDLAQRTALANLQSKLDKAETDKVIAEKESAMLRTAFENLGFDVKDAKEMMSDLVKALGQKNTVQVIK